jgi:hypothetical protein
MVAGDGRIWRGFCGRGLAAYLLIPASSYPAFCSSTFLFVGSLAQAAVTVQLSLLALKSGPHAKQD